MIYSLEQSILAALVYFDIFDYPLTLLEVHRYLLRVGDNSPAKQYTLGEVQSALDTSEALQKAVRFKNGLFYLRGREQILRTRAERFIAAADKYRRASRIVGRWLSYVPFIRLVAVCNSLSFNAARAASDIDLFVVTKKGGVWWARLFALTVLKLLWLRPGQNGVKNKICLSFFVDDEHLNLKPVQAGPEDVYFPVWLGAVYPLYDAGGYYERLWRANNWAREYLINAHALITHPWRTIGRGPIWRILMEWLLAPFNGLAGAFQSRLFPADIKALINLDTRVRVEPGLLKFHTNDRRLTYAREFFKRLKTVSSGLV